MCIVTPLLLTPLLAVILAALNAAVLADGGALQKLAIPVWPRLTGTLSHS